jgi:hypothetical protein
MVTNIQSAKTKLTLSSGIDMPEVKLMLKDIYAKLDELTNEIRKVSENRPRINKDSGRSL